MGSKDFFFLKAHLLLLLILFAPLLASPSHIPGNFGDIYAYHYPLRHLAASTIQEGRVPLWNPYIFGGTPLAANPQAALFYPLSLLHYALPLAWAFSFDAFLHLAAAGLGAFLFLKRRGLDGAGAWVFAMAYGLSPFLVGRIAQGVPTHLAALAWAPWLWLFADAGRPLLFGGALALQILSGHPQFCIINLFALGLSFALKRPSRLLVLATGGLFAFGLCAVQVLPTLEFLLRSVRTVWNPSMALGYSLKPEYLLTLLYPDAFGDPLRRAMEFPSEFFEMLRLYVGLIPLLAAAAGLAAARLPWALLAAGLFFALGQRNPAYPALQKLLGLGFLRVPARFSLLILLGLWLAGAAGWKSLKSGPRLKAALVLMTVLDLFFWASRWVYRQDPARYLASAPRVVSFLRRRPGRIATAPELPSADKGMLYRIPNATGYEAFYLSPIAFYTARSERGPAADGSRTYIRHWDTAQMRRLAVRYYLAADFQPEGMPAFFNRDVYVYENISAGPLLGYAVGGRRVDAERFDLEALGGGPFFVSEAYYPGWQGWVDGKPAPTGMEDGLFISVSLPPGPPMARHSVRLLFRPPAWRIGLALTAASLALAAGLAARAAREAVPA